MTLGGVEATCYLPLPHVGHNTAPPPRTSAAQPRCWSCHSQDRVCLTCWWSSDSTSSGMWWSGRNVQPRPAKTP